MQTIYLEPNQVPAFLRGGYNGKKFQAQVCESLEIPADAGLWSGGSRELFRAVDFTTGTQVALPGQQAAPWDRDYRGDRTVQLKPGFAIVRHSMFCGKDMGLTFYVHPDNAAKLLPAPSAELSLYERIVLRATCCFKSSYGGQDRYQRARGDYDIKRMLAGEMYPTREQWESAKAGLIGKGLLDKRGAVTVAGRNVAK